MRPGRTGITVRPTNNESIQSAHCKHSICSLFIDGIKTIEPGDYPSMESREKFNQKLKKEIDKMGSRFDESYRRGGISTLEIIFAMAQGLNLDDIELSYILLENEF